jgi:hypothetical protein
MGQLELSSSAIPWASWEAHTKATWMRWTTTRCSEDSDWAATVTIHGTFRQAEAKCTWTWPYRYATTICEGSHSNDWVINDYWTIPWTLRRAHAKSTSSFGTVSRTCWRTCFTHTSQCPVVEGSSFDGMALSCSCCLGVFRNHGSCLRN